MEQDKNNILKEFIQTEFPNVTDVVSLASLLNKIFALKYPTKEKVNIVTPKQITFYSHHAKDLYKTFNIQKKSGKLREISAPSHALRLIQELINEILIAYYDTNDCACGFIRGKNITNGAKLHINQHFVLNIDLKDFFDCFEWYQVCNLFYGKRFKKTKQNNVVKILSYICCYPKEVNREIEGREQKVSRYVLPQGAPTSPMLTNFLCIDLDKRLAGLAKKYGAKYSRYADDITFSHSKNIFKTDSSFRKQLEKIISYYPNLQINKEKTRLQGRKYRQEVTGLVVNNKVNVTKRYINDIRKWLYYWEHYGYNRANLYFTQYYLLDKKHTRSSCPGLERVLAGKLYYLKMIKSDTDSTYTKLLSRFNHLTNKHLVELIIDNKTDTNENSIYDILWAIIDSI